MTDIVHGGLAQARPSDPVLRQWWNSVDHWALSCVIILFGIGLLLGLAVSPAFAARHPGMAPFHLVQKQLVFGAVALPLMLYLSMQSPTTVRRVATVGFVLALLALVALPILGQDHDKGAQRWLRIYSLSIQPSEFLKPFFVIFTAWLVAAAQQDNGPPGRMWSFTLLLLIVGLLVIQPDYGQSALIIMTWLAIYFVSGGPIGMMYVLVGLAGLGGFAAYHSSSHFASRIDALFTPAAPTEQVGRAIAAIQEGGFFGVGVGEGQIKWKLPDAQTDFIIAVAAEEYGLVLVLLILGLFLAILVRSLLRLMRERDPFIRYAGVGLVAVLGLQVLVNTGVAVQLLPPKGMTLPFISAGGSSLVAVSITLGMLLAFTRTRVQGEMERRMGWSPAQG